MIFIQNNKFGLMIFTWGFFISILLIYPEYNSSFILPWLCIISGILIFKIFQKKDKRIFFILFIIIFIANPVYSNYRINSWNDQQRNIRGLDYGSIDQYVFDAIIGIRYLDENSTFLSNDGQFYLGKYYIYHYIQIEGDAFYLKKIDFLNMTIIIKNPIEFITDFPNTYEIHPPVWSIDNSVQEKLPNNYYIVNKNIIDFKYFEGVLSTDVNFDIIQRDSYSYYQNNIIIIFYIK
jgi:hypothetical protein